MDGVIGLFFFPGAIACGFALDLIIGDPERFPHPVRGMGRMSVWLEGRLRNAKREGLQRSRLMCGSNRTIARGALDFESARTEEEETQRSRFIRGSNRYSSAICDRDDANLRGTIGFSPQDTERCEDWTAAREGSDFEAARSERRRGAVLVAIVAGLTFVMSALVLWVCFFVNGWLAFAVAAIMCWQCISVRCLALEAG